MPNLNKVMLIGNLTRDPEIRTTPRGSTVAELTIAINRSYKTESGEKKEETTFVDVTLWGRVAEIAGDYARKGRALYVEGRLILDTWEDKQSGQKRSKLKVTGENIQLLGGGERTERSNGGQTQNTVKEDAAPNKWPSGSAPKVYDPKASSAPKANPHDGDDIPF